MAAEGRTLFLTASQRLAAQPKASGSHEPVPGLTAADRAAHRITPGPGRDRAITPRARRSNDESGKVEWQKMSGEDDSVTKRKVRWHGTVDVQQLASPSRLDGGKR